MKTISHLKQGDKVAILCLSSGVLGEDFVKHEIVLGEKRLKEFGLVPVYMDNSLKGAKFISENPKARVNDLKQAFSDKEIKMILTAIGGDDSYKLLPYLMEDTELKSLIENNPKIFIGFSDTTVTHLALHKLGLNTFYGPAYLSDFAEFEPQMLSYTKKWINYLFEPKENLKVEIADTWFEDRTDFSPAAVGTMRVAHKETRGVEHISGKGYAKGELLGGCLEILAELSGDENLIKLLSKDLGKDPDENLLKITKKYQVFPSISDWKNKIMFIETSEKKMSPEDFKSYIQGIKKIGVFDVISGLIVGKPCDEKFYDEYKQILRTELSTYDFPVLMNFNFGHSTPRMVLPYGAVAEIDANKKTLTLVTKTIN